MAVDGIIILLVDRWTPLLRKVGWGRGGQGQLVSKHQIQPGCKEMRRLTRDGMAEPVERDHSLGHKQGQGFFSPLFSWPRRAGLTVISG